MGSRGAHPKRGLGPPSFYCFPFCDTRAILHPFLEIHRPPPLARWQFENGAVIYELIRRKFVGRLDRGLMLHSCPKDLYSSRCRLNMEDTFSLSSRFIQSKREVEKSIYIHVREYIRVELQRYINRKQY